MKFELFDKIKPRAQAYVGQEIVEVRVFVNPKCVNFPLIEIPLFCGVRRILKG